MGKMALEKLLNILCEKGWKPFGFYDRMYLSDKSSYQYHKVEGIKSYFFVKGNGVGDHFTLRQLVSKESGLWQFICDNGMYDYKMGEHKNIVEDFFWNERENCNYYGYLWDKSCWEYYVVESALCDEDKLEQFLLDNIKVE